MSELVVVPNVQKMARSRYAATKDRRKRCPNVCRCWCLKIKQPSVTHYTDENGHIMPVTLNITSRYYYYVKLRTK